MSSFVPSLLFVVVGWTSFFWPAEVVVGRNGLVITSLLTIASMYTGIRQTSPTTSYVKALDVWMLMCILLTTVPLLQYTLILSWRKTSDSSVTKVVPGLRRPLESLPLKSMRHARDGWPPGITYLFPALQPCLLALLPDPEPPRPQLSRPPLCAAPLCRGAL
ncbi:gamma-aminobutyric acid receptor subunit beta-like isoform X2 [Portunus trituberculatus]|uniref:gamma-aminobutyric acid receptor subunit beta-like isoform X2 n=1 Tax=Portunus trituberculatus TaxID=210409 RepID=UPI001E1D02A9|nr:gamma-aminobutyric acid receptor subunit beta-like isoform X2 [Portunus trituberculatus]XP_045115044.1 gamma-aminobutyric acid receptor subunit beta-like isoform X2 [Portunus trituberculatus]